MSHWTTFFSVHIGIFFTFYTFAIRSEFDNLNNKINSLQNDNREISQQLNQKLKI